MLATLDSALVPSSAPLTISLHRSLAAAEADWRALEREGISTPYQRFDWISAVLSVTPHEERSIAIAVLRAGALPVAVLPMQVERRFGVARATLIGADIGNSDWMPIHQAATTWFTRPVLEALLARIGTDAGIDCLALFNQPAEWRGVPNPFLAFPYQTGPDHFYSAALTPDRLVAKRLRNIRRGKRRLEEVMGPVSLRRADSPEAIASVGAEFLRQRDIRFRQMGIANVFREPMSQLLFTDAATRSLGAAAPVFRFHALHAGETVVATCCGLYGGGHYSQYINSTTDGPAAKYSLMGIAMCELAEELAAEGITSIDLGLGDFEYKTEWCDKHAVFDAVIPLTARGRLAAKPMMAARRVKRAIKQTPLLWAAAKGIRSLLVRR